MSKSFLMVGYGATTKYLVSQLLEQNYTVDVYDDNTNITIDISNITIYNNVKNINWVKYQYIYTTPGVNKLFLDNSEITYLAGKNGVFHISELDLKFFLHPERIFIGVTGSNGKTTTSTLIYHILKQNNIDVSLTGTEVQHISDSDVEVIEVNNLVLGKGIFHMAFNCAIITNITSNHLDQNIIQQYEYLKYSILKKHPYVQQLFLAGSNVTAIPFAKFSDLLDIDTSKLPENLKLKHNTQNFIFAATAVNKLFNISLDDCYLAAASYQFAPYRQEIIYNKNNIKIINDSKSTTVDATIHAISNYQNIYLIIGGIFKSSTEDLDNIIKYKDLINTIYIFGRDRFKLSDYLSKYFKTICCETLSEIVNNYHNNWRDIIIFSPMCSSFDQYSNYKYRGEDFSTLISKYFQ